MKKSLTYISLVILQVIIICGLTVNTAFAAAPSLRITSVTRMHKYRVYNIYVRLYPNGNKLCSFRTNVTIPYRYLRIRSVTAGSGVLTLEKKYSTTTGRVTFAGAIPRCTTLNTAVLKISVKAIRRTSRSTMYFNTTELYNSVQKPVTHYKYKKVYRVVR